MPPLTEAEQAAIRGARQPLHAALVAIGRDKPFDGATAAEMDSVITAIWQSCKTSMQKHFREPGADFDDEIPF